jgi:8-oxo-dGTP pyrophosphatase MutT (NUDIX family)
MIGGGIEAGEESLPAAARELEEETGLHVGLDQLTHLSTITAEIDEKSTGKHYTFVTDLYLVKVGNNTLTASDDIQGLQELTTGDIQDLIHRYQSLPKEINPDKGFAWYDYGQLYGAIHQIALDTLAH